MRATAALSRLLRLPGIHVRRVALHEARVVVTVALRCRRLVRPDCGFSTPSRYDRRPVSSVRRHLDLGAWRLEVKAAFRRPSCHPQLAERRLVPADPWRRTTTGSSGGSPMRAGRKP